MTHGSDRRISDDEQYYREHASEFGWGVEVARLDTERVGLLNRYVVGHRILDVACGSGMYTDYLASRGFDAWGIDLVGEFILKAKESKKGTYLQGEADKLPFADGDFDTVLLFDILEHGDDVAILKEAKRVAAKRIVVNVPRKVDMELQRTGIVFGHYIDKSHMREYTEDSIRSLAHECGLEIIHLQGSSHINPLDVYKALFSGNLFVKRVIKVILMTFLNTRYYPTGYFAVFDSDYGG